MTDAGIEPAEAFATGSKPAPVSNWVICLVLTGIEPVKGFPTGV